MTKQLICKKLIIESNCLITINLLNDDKTPDSHNLLPFIKHCRLSFKEFHLTKVLHVHKEENACADGLAKHALHELSDCVLFSFVPCFLSAKFLANCVEVEYPRKTGVG